MALFLACSFWLLIRRRRSAYFFPSSRVRLQEPRREFVSNNSSNALLLDGLYASETDFFLPLFSASAEMFYSPTRVCVPPDSWAEASSTPEVGSMQSWCDTLSTSYDGTRCQATCARRWLEHRVSCGNCKQRLVLRGGCDNLRSILCFATHSNIRRGRSPR